MKLTITSKTFAFFSYMQQSVARIPGPIRVLQAQEQLNKFRKLDADALADIGKSQADVAQASLRDFL